MPTPSVKSMSDIISEVKAICKDTAARFGSPLLRVFGMNSISKEIDALDPQMTATELSNFLLLHLTRLKPSSRSGCLLRFLDLVNRYVSEDQKEDQNIADESFLRELRQLSNELGILPSKHPRSNYFLTNFVTDFSGKVEETLGLNDEFHYFSNHCRRLFILGIMFVGQKKPSSLSHTQLLRQNLIAEYVSSLPTQEERVAASLELSELERSSLIPQSQPSVADLVSKLDDAHHENRQLALQLLSSTEKAKELNEAYQRMVEQFQSVESELRGKLIAADKRMTELEEESSASAMQERPRDQDELPQMIVVPPKEIKLIEAVGGIQCLWNFLVSLKREQLALDQYFRELRVIGERIGFTHANGDYENESLPQNLTPLRGLYVQILENYSKSFPDLCGLLFGVNDEAEERYRASLQYVSQYAGELEKEFRVFLTMAASANRSDISVRALYSTKKKLAPHEQLHLNKSLFNEIVKVIFQIFMKRLSMLEAIPELSGKIPLAHFVDKYASFSRRNLRCIEEIATLQSPASIIDLFNQQMNLPPIVSDLQRPKSGTASTVFFVNNTDDRLPGGAAAASTQRFNPRPESDDSDVSSEYWPSSEDDGDGDEEKQDESDNPNQQV